MKHEQGNGENFKITHWLRGVENLSGQSDQKT
jgi:hypothetical protein